MALCRDCSRVMPCPCHVTPPIQVRPGVYLVTEPHLANLNHPPTPEGTHVKPLLHIPADALQVGDVIVQGEGETTVRRLDRSKAPAIVTNPGDDDQIDGYLWQHVTVRRDA